MDRLKAWLGVGDAKTVARLIGVDTSSVTQNTTSLSFEHVWLVIDLPELGWSKVNVDPSWKLLNVPSTLTSFGLDASQLPKFDRDAFTEQTSESP